MPPDDSDNSSTSSSSSSVPRIDLADATPTFLRTYYLNVNAPFILVNVATDWKATREWVAPGEEHDFVTIDLLEAAFRGCGEKNGSIEDVLIPVVECGDDTEGHHLGGGGTRSGSTSESSSSSAYGEELRRERRLAEYAALWRSGEAEARGLYLKDWHIVKALRSHATDGRRQGAMNEIEEEISVSSSSPTASTGEEECDHRKDEDLRPATAISTSPTNTEPSTLPSRNAPPPYYTVPSPLDDDWLNAWWDAPAAEAGHAVRNDDYRFLYLGPKGTSTGWHHDVLCSYSWSANLAGIKEWTLFPPSSPPPSAAAGIETATADSNLMTKNADWEQQTKTQPPFIHSTSSASTPPPPTTTSDVLSSPHPAAPPALVVRQGPGEVIFVPSGWHHQVRNLTGCLSLNHNWFNRSSLPRVWAFLKEEAKAVQERLGHLRETFDEDVSGWERQCEVVLRANSAMNLTEWTGLLVWKARGVRREDGGVNRKEARQDLAAILGVLRELAASSAGYLSFIFPPHLHPEGKEVEEEDGAPRLPLRVDLLPRVEAWLAAEIEEMEI